MILPLQIKIRNDPNLYRYLREHSHWYKTLNRNPRSIDLMEEEMRQAYKLTPSDKLNKLNEQITLIRTFMDMMK